MTIFNSATDKTNPHHEPNPNPKLLSDQSSSPTSSDTCCLKTPKLSVQPQPWQHQISPPTPSVMLKQQQRHLNTTHHHPLDFDHRHTIPPRQHVSNGAAQAFKLIYPNQPMSLSGISLRAFVLGTVFSSALSATLLALLLTSSPLWRIPFFISALSLFHFLEFWTTAARNTPEATVSAFLLSANWPAYPIAHTMACLECLVTNTLFADRRWAPPHTAALPLALGLLMVAAGQVVRSMAMMHAGTSFNHTVQTRKADSHTLVTTGVYGLCRHPGYFGFFYWGLGTQMVLGNAFCFVGYAYVLWRFFSGRVRVEEGKLVEFFGGEYLRYRARVGTMMPFVG